MQNFILLTLIIGLGFFLYLLQNGQISTENFNIKKLQGETEFVIKKSEYNDPNSTIKSSDIYAIIQDKEYKIFNFSGDDFNKLKKFEYSLDKYKVPFEALDAVTGTWIGNRYVFYILEKNNKETGKKIFEIYKAEYATDDVSKLKYFKIKSVEEDEVENQFEVTY
jgi:hypothetical protein